MPVKILLVMFGSEKVKEKLKMKRKFVQKFFELIFSQPNGGLFYAGNGKDRVYN